MGCTTIVQRGCALELYLGEDEGLLTYDSDAGDLVPAIQRVLRAWPEFEQRARRGAKIIRREFAMGRVASQYLRFLTFLAAKPRPGRTMVATGELVQKRSILKKGLLLGSSDVYQRQTTESLARWEPRLASAPTPHVAIDMARELVLEYAAASDNINGRPADEPSLARAFQLYRNGADRYPRSLVIRFNFVRAALHFGDPLTVTEALKLAQETLEQPSSHWTVDPMEDVFPWDFFPTHFDYRSYFDAVTNQVMGGPDASPSTVDLIRAALHNYLGHYDNQLSHREEAVALAPAFPYYKMRLALQLLQAGGSANYARAGSLLVELAEGSIVFQQAFDLLRKLKEKGLFSPPQFEELESTIRKAGQRLQVIETMGTERLQSPPDPSAPPLPTRVSGRVTVHKRRQRQEPVKVSVILLDWSCRESFHSFQWLANQTVPRDQYELIWVELFDRVPPEALEAADVVLTCHQQGMYHKHEGYNEGLLAASGQIITVCDSDAAFSQDYIESIIKVFRLDTGDDPSQVVLMHHEWRSPESYPARLSSVDQLPQFRWKELWPNVGASMSVAVRDAIRFGGFDEHPGYRGYLCGPYELGWRLVNAGLPEVWHQQSFLFHFNHPHASQNDNEPGWNEMLFPHVEHHAGLAVEAFSSGRVLPLQPNPEIQRQRMASRRIGTQFEVKYSRMLGSPELAKISGLLQAPAAEAGKVSPVAPPAEAPRPTPADSPRTSGPSASYENSDRYLVSALVPTYNSARFMRGLLEDLEAQTIADRMEIVIVDTASPTDERSIVESFQKRYDNIVYVRTSHRENSHSAINRCLRQARGKYVTLACTDDRHRRDAYERMVAVLESRPDIALVYADSYVTQKENETFETHRPHTVLGKQDFDPLRLVRQCFVGPQPMWRRSLHDRYGYLDEGLERAADWDMWLRFAAGESFLHIDEVLGLYLNSPTSSEHINPEQSRSEALAVHQRYLHRAASLQAKRNRASENLPAESGVLVLVPGGVDAPETVEGCVASIRASAPQTEELTVRVARASDQVQENRLGVRVSPPTPTLLESLRQGIATEARYVVLVSPDVTVPPLWLVKMLEVAESAPEIAAVGPRAKEAPAPQRAVGPEDSAATGGKGSWQEVDYLGGFCLLLRSEAVLSVGGLDSSLPLAETLWQLYGRLRAAGFKLACAQDVFVEHQELTGEEGGSYDDMAVEQLAADRALAPGRDALQAGDLEKAVTEFNLAAERFPEMAAAHAAVGATLVALERHEEAAAALRRAVDLAQEAGPLHDQLGVALFRAGDLRGAEAEFLRARELDPGEMQPCLNLVDLYWSQQRYDEATGAIKDALQLDPNHPDAIATFGFLCLDLGDIDGAKMATDRLQMIDPQHGDIEALQRATSGAQEAGAQPISAGGDDVAEGVKQEPAASQQDEPATSKEENMPQLTMTEDAMERALAEGKAALERGDLEGAAVEFDRLTKSMPDLAAAHTALGSTLMALQRVDEAIPALRRAAELAPHAAALHNQLGVALYQKGDLVAAEAVFRQARAVDPGDIQTTLNLVDLYRDQQRYAEATQEIKEALRLDANHPETIVAFTVLCLELGDGEGSEMGVRRLESVAPEHPDLPALREALTGTRQEQFV